MNPFQSLRDRELFVYTLTERLPRLLHSTLTVARRGRLHAELTGELALPDGFRLSVYERLTWDAGLRIIEGYSYEAWRGSDKLYWCDSQPHLGDQALAGTDPHHKHIPPDIRHHRVPAADLSFTEPNLLFLRQEIETLLQG